MAEDDTSGRIATRVRGRAILREYLDGGIQSASPTTPFAVRLCDGRCGDRYLPWSRHLGVVRLR